MGRRTALSAGDRLRASVTGRYELADHELVLLDSACAQADMIARLEALLADDLTTRGAAGQVRLSAAVTELRQSRLALSRLLTDLALPPDEGEQPVKLQSPASRRASRAATYRHTKDRRREVNRRGSAEAG